MITNYKVMRGDIDGHTWINNTRHRVGDTVAMDENAAKYLELSGQLEKDRPSAPVKPKASRTAKAKPAADDADKSEGGADE